MHITNYEIIIAMIWWTWPKRNVDNGCAPLGTSWIFIPLHWNSIRQLRHLCESFPYHSHHNIFIRIWCAIVDGDRDRKAVGRMNKLHVFSVSLSFDSQSDPCGCHECVVPKIFTLEQMNAIDGENSVKNSIMPWIDSDIFSIYYCYDRRRKEGKIIMINTQQRQTKWCVDTG